MKIFNLITLKIFLNQYKKMDYKFLIDQLLIKRRIAMLGKIQEKLNNCEHENAYFAHKQCN